MRHHEHRLTSDEVEEVCRLRSAIVASSKLVEFDYAKESRIKGYAKGSKDYIRLAFTEAEQLWESFQGYLPISGCLRFNLLLI